MWRSWQRFCHKFVVAQDPGQTTGLLYRRCLPAIISVALVVTTFVVYWPVRNYEFVRYDDDKYITENWRVRDGITTESVVWAFTEAHFHMWHPLTTLSQMLDCQLFGLSPGRHHLTSLLVHVINALLLFCVLKRMTGAIWPSAFVAAVFVLHPLQVESVAWLSERKNVLSGLFWILTIGTYVRYTERPNISRYILVVLVFGLCIMTKPIVVTLPFVLLLLDYWPLGRLELRAQSESIKSNDRRVTVQRLIVEKIPLFFLAGVLGLITYNVQKGGGVVAGLEKLTLRSRAANAIVSYLTYIQKMIWPSRLAVFYPHPLSDFSIVRVVVCGVLLVLFTIIFIYSVRRRKYLAVGWLWYVGTLVPVIGLVQVGAQAMADRYMYITMIGLLVIVAWGASELVARWRYRRITLGILSLVVVLVLSICTYIQQGYWRNSITLFKHTLRVTRNNYVTHNSLGFAFKSRGRFDEAMSHYRQALEINPNYADGHNNLGVALQLQGEFDQAMNHFRRAIDIDPKHSKAHDNLGVILAKQGNLDAAITHLFKAVGFNPKNDDAHYNLGLVLAQKGEFAQAAIYLRGSLKLNPEDPYALSNLACVLTKDEKSQFRDYIEAVRMAERACKRTDYKNAQMVDILTKAREKVALQNQAK